MMTLESAKEMDRRCVLNWLMDIILNPAEAFNTYSYEQQIELAHDAIVLLKEQEQEISRLKHYVDCDAVEKLPSGCVGYGRGFNDDEPCETCKACEKYIGYGIE